jgi:hypothetical protein
MKGWREEGMEGRKGGIAEGRVQMSNGKLRRGLKGPRSRGFEWRKEAAIPEWVHGPD